MALKSSTHKFLVLFENQGNSLGSLIINDCDVYEMVRLLESMSIAYCIDRFVVSSFDSGEIRNVISFRRASLLKGFDFSDLFSFV